MRTCNPNCNIPETVEDEVELSIDTAKWQYPSNERGEDRMGQTALFGNLTVDLVDFDCLLRPLQTEREVDNSKERHAKGGGAYMKP